jgi:hypothetical protein
MRTILMLLFGAIFIVMTAVTVRASLAAGLLEAWPDYVANPWAVATLYDAYFAFITFYVWVAYRERSMAWRIVWFLLIMGLGSIAMSFYVLLQLVRLRPGEPLETLLRRREA